MNKLKCVHASGKYDVPAPDYRSRAHLITRTETQASKLGGHGWGVIKADIGPRSDPAIEYDKSKLQLTDGYLIPISTKEYKRDGGGMSGQLFAAVGLFDIEGFDKKFLQIVAHMPRWSQPERRDTYLEGLDNIKAIVERESKNAIVRISCDWNRDLKKVSIRSEIKEELNLKLMVWDWARHIPVEGTFGKMLYDGSLFSRHRLVENLDTFLMESPPEHGLDHRPYKCELALHT